MVVTTDAADVTTDDVVGATVITVVVVAEPELEPEQEEDEAECETIEGDTDSAGATIVGVKGATLAICVCA